MRTRMIGLAALLAVAAAAGLAACGGDETTTVTETTSGGETAAGDLPQGSEHVEIDPSEFTTEIDNPYWPMAVGSKWVYREFDSEGTEQKVVVTVTDKTKRIANGVEARVVRDVVTEDGVPTEVTDDWYAQDAEGNIWYMGEDTTEYEDGKPVSKSGSFEAGVDGAEPGIILPADPQPGMTYRQEYYEGEAEDLGSIVALGEQAEVPAGHYEDVLMTRDTNPLEPKVLEFKFYAPDVGPVLATSVSGGSDREELLSFTPGR
jgi:ABC-type glycerol-3-phosphate transport system substrate-binding protein